MSTNDTDTEDDDEALWECDRCGHVNDGGEWCMGPKCVDFREWAASQPQEDEPS